GAARRTRSAPSCSPARSLRLAFGITATVSTLACSPCADAQGQREAFMANKKPGRDRVWVSQARSLGLVAGGEGPRSLRDEGGLRSRRRRSSGSSGRRGGLSSRLLRSRLFRSRLLRRLLSSGLLRSLLCRSLLRRCFLRSCHINLLDHVAKSTVLREQHGDSPPDGLPLGLQPSGPPRCGERGCEPRAPILVPALRASRILISHMKDR